VSAEDKDLFRAMVMLALLSALGLCQCADLL
jgi:hypothetical protein